MVGESVLFSKNRSECGGGKRIGGIEENVCRGDENGRAGGDAGIIVAGWDKHKGGQVFAIPVGGGLLPRPFAIGGSGSTYIYGFCDAYYRPGMNAQQCEEFVAKALSHAMARDGSSGGVIRTVRIDGSGVERKMIPGNKLPYGPL